jgi:hypothetical protein
LVFEDLQGEGKDLCETAVDSFAVGFEEYGGEGSQGGVLLDLVSIIGIFILFISHHLNNLQELVDVIIGVINKGAVINAGECQDFKNDAMDDGLLVFLVELKIEQVSHGSY